MNAILFFVTCIRWVFACVSYKIIVIALLAKCCHGLLFVVR